MEFVVFVVTFSFSFFLLRGLRVPPSSVGGENVKWPNDLKKFITFFLIGKYKSLMQRITLHELGLFYNRICPNTLVLGTNS